MADATADLRKSMGTEAGEENRKTGCKTAGGGAGKGKLVAWLR